MDVVDALLRLGGVASHRALVGATSRWAVRAALAAGRVERLGQGVYALPGLDEHVAAARRLRGVLSHTSAARHWGWGVWIQPDRPWVTVPRNRRTDARARGIVVVRQDVATDGIATTPLQTVLDCARRLRFEEGLAVADSALRSGLVGPEELVRAAGRLPRPGRAVEVAREADPRADNPFESVVRALALGVPGLHLVPQVQVVGYGRGDLVDVRRRLVVECDSFGFHASRAALLSDTERHNRAALCRATLVRFGYEHAHRPDYVRRVLTEWAALPPPRHTVPLPWVGSSF